MSEEAKYLDEIRERAEGATPGPYEFIYYEWTDGGVRMASKGLSAPSDSVAFHASNYPRGTKRGDQDALDMEFLAHARQDIPFLLSRFDELEREVAEWRASSSEEARRAMEEILGE